MPPIASPAARKTTRFLAPETEATVRMRRALVAVGALLFFAIAFVPSGLHRIEGLGHRPAFAAAVAALMAFLWFTEAIPIGWTALLPIVLFPPLKVFGGGFANGAAKSLRPFLDAYIFLFLGGMAIGAAMEEWGLHRRVALHILRVVGTEPKRLLAGVLIATSFISLWLSNTATAVMMLPIAMALISQLEVEAGGRRLPFFGSAIALSVAYGSNVGGIGTKIGTGTNSLFVGFVSKQLGIDIGFLQYIAIGLPFVLLFLPVVWWVLWRIGREDRLPEESHPELVERELRALGPLTKNERKVAIVFSSAAALWIGSDALRKPLARFVPVFWEGFTFQAKHYEAAVAMAAALALAAIGALSFAAIRRIPFSTLLLLGGSFSMAAGIDGSGLGRFLAANLAGIAALPMVVQIGITALATIALTAIASNTATVSVLLNVLPRSLPLLATTAIAASCDFMLPAGTPPNAIVFGSGYVRLGTMMRVGFALDVAAAALITLYAWFYLPLVM